MKETFSDRQIAEFLRRSYFTVDGLWFVKIEETHGFDEAMWLDEAIWDVMSKIQAMKAKSLLGIESGGLAELGRAFQLKLAAEGHEYYADIGPDQVKISVRVCPWYEILKSSGRTHVAQIIADRICAREFAGWTREFGGDIKVEFGGRICVEGCEKCEIVFRKAKRLAAGLTPSLSPAVPPRV